MNLLDRGAAWLLSQSQAAAGSTATYVRGATRTSVVIVRKVRNELVDDGSGVPISVRRYIVKIAAADLPFEPRQGDRIEEVVGLDTITWEVLPPANDEPAFRFWDRSQSAYLINVAQIGA